MRAAMYARVSTDRQGREQTIESQLAALHSWIHAQNHNLDPKHRDIEQYGWRVVLVLAQESEPAFAYTIGLYESFRHAEVIIFGLSLDLMHDILNVIGKAIRAGMVFASGTESSAILDGYHCAFRAVSAQWYPKYMGVALDYYSTTTFPVVQCFWPNKDGLYPWDERISAAWWRRQPVLAGAA